MIKSMNIQISLFTDCLQTERNILFWNTKFSIPNN